MKKNIRPRDLRSEERREQDLRNSAAVRGVDVETLRKQRDSDAPDPLQKRTEEGEYRDRLNRKFSSE